MPITRRQFHSVVGAVGLSAFGARSFADDKSKPLRVIAYNVYACHGWPDDRGAAKEAFKSGRIARQLATALARHQPDIVNFSESPSETMAKEVASLLDMQQVRFPSGGSWPGTLLSRHKIVSSKNVPLVSDERPKELFTRHWGRGTIELPGGEALVVHSAHLHPSDRSIRLREIEAMLASMQSDLAAGRSMLLIGDLNHEPDGKEYRLWQKAGWVDTFAKVGHGNGFTIKADRPDGRIDYVWAAGPIAQRAAESRPLFEGAFRLDLADPQSYALSDHLPQFARFNP